MAPTQSAPRKGSKPKSDDDRSETGTKKSAAPEQPRRTSPRASKSPGPVASGRVEKPSSPKTTSSRTRSKTGSPEPETKSKRKTATKPKTAVSTAPSTSSANGKRSSASGASTMEQMVQNGRMSPSSILPGQDLPAAEASIAAQKKKKGCSKCCCRPIHPSFK